MTRMSMPLDLSPLAFSFGTKPLLIGGKAMEYYGLRKAGADVDLVITSEDYRRLAAQYPDNRRDIWGDLGVCVHGFEIWQTIVLFDYEYLSAGAIEEENVRVISLDRLLFTRVLAMKVEKYRRDLDLVLERILNDALSYRLKYLDGTPLDQFVRNSDLVVVGESEGGSADGAGCGSAVRLKVMSAWSFAHPDRARTAVGTTVAVSTDAVVRDGATCFMLLKAVGTGGYALVGSDAVAGLEGGAMVHRRPESPLGRCIHGRSLVALTEDVKRASARDA